MDGLNVGLSNCHRKVTMDLSNKKQPKLLPSSAVYPYNGMMLALRRHACWKSVRYFGLLKADGLVTHGITRLTSIADGHAVTILFPTKM